MNCWFDFFARSYFTIYVSVFIRSSLWVRQQPNDSLMSSRSQPGQPRNSLHPRGTRGEHRKAPPSQRPLSGDCRLEHRGHSPSDSCCARIRSYVSRCQLTSIRAEPAVNAAKPHPASGLCAAIAGWSQAYNGIRFTSGVRRGVVTSASMSLYWPISIVDRLHFHRYGPSV